MQDWRKAHWPRAGNRTAAETGAREWRERAVLHADDRVRAFAMGLSEDPQGRLLLASLFGNSPFLSSLLLKEMEFMRGLLRYPLRQTVSSIFKELADAAQAAEEDEALLRQKLRKAKGQIALTTAIADIGNLWPLPDVMQTLSDFADRCVHHVAEHALRRAAREGWLKLPDLANPLACSGYLILALGKLGSHELNFSSDIDLIAFYEPGHAQIADLDKANRHYVRLTQRIMDILSDRTEDGYVFRTDLRLRPDPSVTPICLSLAAAENYYFTVGQTWERAAMLRARPIAGDPRTTESFLNLIEPFVWRRHLDFAALEDIRAIKRQIRSHKGHGEIALNGHDIKLGAGGIREVEFFAQTQQLIFGGRDQTLRTGHTLNGLNALAAAKHVSAKTAAELAESYLFLRRVEHRLQMVDDLQTYALPQTDTAFAELGCFLGYDEPGFFRTDLWNHLHRVQKHYAALFAENEPVVIEGNLVLTGVENDPATLETLGRIGFRSADESLTRLRGWLSGRARILRGERQQQTLMRVLPRLLLAFAETPDPDATLLQFDDLLARLPVGAPLLPQLDARPSLISLLTEILGTAPYLSDLLRKRPELLDTALLPDFWRQSSSLAGRAETLRRRLQNCSDLEDAFTAIHLWTEDQRFAAGLATLRQDIPPLQSQRLYSGIAQTVIQELLPFVQETFEERHGRFAAGAFALVALGKLGERSMTARSDLDLIVIYKDQPVDALSDGQKPLSAPQYYGRLTQSLVTALTAQTGLGPLYAVDLRLRPSGNAGPLASSFDAFLHYQKNEAWAWEHMALTRARVVAATQNYGEKIEGAINEILRLPRDSEKLRKDVLAMRQRIAQEHAGIARWDFKYHRGGLIDIDFITQYLLLRHAADHPFILTNDMAAALRRLSAAGLLKPETAEELRVTLEWWRSLIGWFAVTTGSLFDPSRAAVRQKEMVAQLCSGSGRNNLDFAALERMMTTAQESIENHFTHLVGALN